MIYFLQNKKNESYNTVFLCFFHHKKFILILFKHFLLSRDFYKLTFCRSFILSQNTKLSWTLATLHILDFNILRKCLFICFCFLLINANLFIIILNSAFFSVFCCLIYLFVWRIQKFFLIQMFINKI